jgi:hypothetical protein
MGGLNAAPAMTPSFTEAAAMGAQGQPMGMNIAMANAPAAKSGMGAMDAMRMAKMGNSLMNQEQQQPQGSASRPPQAGQVQSAQQIAEILKRKGIGRSNWAGLLGAALGGGR